MGAPKNHKESIENSQEILKRLSIDPRNTKKFNQSELKNFLNDEEEIQFNEWDHIQKNM